MDITIKARNLDSEFVMLTKESWQTLLVLLDASASSMVHIDDLGDPVCGPYSIWEVVALVNELIQNIAPIV